MIAYRPAIFRGGLLLSLCILAACSGSKDDRARAAPEVGTIVARASEVPVSVSLSGRTVAFETSEVRPQVSGLIRRRLFTEGSFVNAGQPLYQIDSSLYRAAVNQAEANLASARASAEAATARAARYKPLAEAEAVSQQDYTDAAAQERVAKAGVAQNSAALETARINLRYTTVTAPISGRIGRSLATNGALVSASQAAPLATIQRFDPIYVDMQQSSAELTELRRALDSGKLVAGSTSVRLRLEDGSFYDRPGTLQFSEISVAESTGTVTLRARFPNPQGLLLPGMFVTAVFDQSVEPGAYLVPQAAVQRDFNGSAYVFVVGPDSKAKRRTIETTRTSGTDWVVTGGLKPGERIITQGLANVRQDAEVKPVPQTAPQPVGPPKAGGSRTAPQKAK